MNKKNGSVYVPVRIGATQYAQLEKLSIQTKRSKSEIVREFIKKGLSVNSFEEDEKRILQLIKQALAEELDEPVERLAAITAKGTHTSAAAYFSLIEVIKLLVPEEEKYMVPTLAAKARRLGIEYLKSKPAKVDEFFEKNIKEN